MSELLQLLTMAPCPIPPGVGRIHSTMFDNRVSDAEDEKWFDCQCCSGGFTIDEMHIKADGKVGVICERCSSRQRARRHEIRAEKKGLK